jgi:hypothetical protein
MVWKNIYKVGQIVKDEDGVESMVVKTEDDLIMYQQPKPDRTYVAGADVAEGVTGGDYSVMTIFDRKTGEEVAMWRGYMTADRFGAFLNKVGRIYNNALMVVEINNHGLTTVTALKNLMYPQIYFRPVIKMDTVAMRFSDRMGWKTTKVTRPIMIDDLRESLADGSLILHSEKTLDEMLTFVFDVFLLRLSVFRGLRSCIQANWNKSTMKVCCQTIFRIKKGTLIQF